MSHQDTAGYPVWEHTVSHIRILPDIRPGSPCVSHQLERGREERAEAGARGIYLYT